jgi:hypothetical protein
VRDDPFDLDNLRLTPEAAAAMGRAAAAKPARAQPKRQRQQFVMVPWWWVERLKGARYTATFLVAHHVLLQHWKTGGRPVPVSNMALKPLGVSRWAKWRALQELKRLGLVNIQTRHRRVPLITLRAKS